MAVGDFGGVVTLVQGVAGIVSGARAEFEQRVLSQTLQDAVNACLALPGGFDDPRCRSGDELRVMWEQAQRTQPTAPAPPAATATLPPQPGGTNMSMLGDIGRAIAPALGGIIGAQFSTIGSAAGTQLGTAMQQASLAQRAAAQPGTGMMQTMASLPRIAGVIGGAAGTVVGAVSIGARTVYRSAATYCRRHPAWCAQIGGTAAIASMIQGGQLPPIKRRRARGISATEFRGFRRVHNVLKDFCAPRMRVRPRGLKGRR